MSAESPTTSRRAFIAGAAAGLGGAGMGISADAVAGPARWGRNLPLVDDGQSLAIVVVEDGAAPEIVRAAGELVDHVELATGVRLPVVSHPSEQLPAAPTTIYVGFAGPGAHPRTAVRAATLDRDGYRIDTCIDTITILGPSTWGTVNGVYGFLERFLDAAWLMPTAVGTDVPAVDQLIVPPGQIESNPSYAMRIFSPLIVEPGSDGPYPEQYVWAQRNRMQGSYNRPIDFHHNLWSLFPVSEFGVSHPEYYANGTPPAEGVQVGWQPAFSEPGTVDVVVAKIRNYFANFPHKESFSLGVNDGGGFGESDPVTAYYTWVNEVVGRLSEDFPDKRFGLLAYHELEQAPSFPLHPQVVPFITQDRSAWADPAVRAAAESLLQQWQSLSTEIGLYDYLYGNPYMLPRVQPHLMAEVLRFGKSVGSSAHYAELYPNWGEGPKAWVAARLQWDVNLDVDDLLDEWYVRAVGADAAPHLAAYYEIWERFWNEVVPGTAWFKPDATYQAFNLASYLGAVDLADVRESRRLLDQVVSLADTPVRRARAEALRHAFDYYEASVLSYPTPVDVPSDAEAALVILQNVEAHWQEREDALPYRLELIDEFDSDPLLIHPRKPQGFGLTWGALHPSELWSVIDYLRAQEPAGGLVTSWLEARLTSGTSTFDQYIRLVHGIATDTLTSLTSNASFDDDGSPAPWDLWVKSTGQLELSSAVAHTGDRSVVARGLARGGPAQAFAIGAGLVATRGWVHAPEGGYRGTVQTDMNLRASGPVQLTTVHGALEPLDGHPGWWPVDTLHVVPAEIRGAIVASGQYVLVIDGHGADPDVHLDDCVVYQARA